MLGADEKPDIKYSDVGGLDSQKQEIREAVELPMEQVSYIELAELPES
jgi:26S proteasome regulatory subunit T3